MLEAQADLWSYLGKVEHLCITTNSIVTKGGLAVMGRGCAKEAAFSWPESREALASQLKLWGNYPHALGIIGRENMVWNYGDYRLSELMALAQTDLGGTILWSYPVKHHWKDKAELSIIERSAIRMKRIFAQPGFENQRVVLVRPGCGNGHLTWEAVRPVIAGILDDKFTVVSPPAI